MNAYSFNVDCRAAWLSCGAAAAGLVLASATPACATDGYFAVGYGVQSKGLAGAGLAYPKDSLALATNPAAAFDLGDRVDVDVEYFRPGREGGYSGTALDRTYGGDGSKASLIPEVGLTRRVGERWVVGLAVYGNGGMLTKYRDNPYARFGAAGDAGVNLMQVFISPTVAYEIAPGHSLGVSFNLGVQRFTAEGIGAFAAFSEDPAQVSDKGAAVAVAYGARIGYLGHLTPRLSVGAFWQSKAYSGKFDKYAGLFADHGAFDIPSSYGAGLAFKATDRLDLVADLRRIEYGGIPAVTNPVGLLFAGRPLGSVDGPGFGWKSVTAYKLGANYRISDAWQVRAGWGRVTDPIPRDQTFLNILAPGVVRDQFTAGATWTRSSGFEVSAYAMRAPKHTVRGSGSIPDALGGGEANISLEETAIGIGFGWKH